MRPRHGSTSLGDLARHLDLSKATVSRALNDYPDIASATKERVAAAARELGYTPSSLARRLARGTVDTVGFVLPAAGSDPFLAAFLDGLSHAFGLHDRDLIVVACEDDGHEIDQYRRLIRGHKVDGFVVTRTRVDDPRIDFLLAERFPFVAHGRTRDPSRYAWLDIDAERAFFEATSHLLTLGHRRLAFLGGPADYNLTQVREAGFRRAVASAGHPVDPPLVARCALSATGGWDQARTLLAAADRPTAFVCASDTIAIGALRAIHEAGLTCPADLSVIGYDAIDVGAFVDPPLTTMSQSTRQAGLRIAEILIAVIQGDAPERHQELWDARLIHRASDGPPPAS